MTQRFRPINERIGSYFQTIDGMMPLYIDHLMQSIVNVLHPDAAIEALFCYKRQTKL